MQFDDDTVERLAQLAYQRHAPHDGTPWVRLDDDGREANRDGVRAIPDLVAPLGYRVVTASERPTVEQLTRDEVERAAVAEHERWMRFTQRRGYTFGPRRDPVRRTHPDLRPWEDLDEPTREKDRVRVRAIPDLLRAVGLSLTSVEHAS